MSFTSVQNVVVIGAGIAGVATAAVLKASGIKVTVLEKQAGIGGLWYSNYPGCGVQTSAELYEFPDMKYPDEIRSRSKPPSAKEVCDYLEEYVKLKKIEDCFRFNTEVLSVSQSEDKTWTVRSRSAKRKETVEHYTYVVVCTGLFSGCPNIPEFKGSSDFVKAGGEILHTSEWKSYDQLKGKRTVVVGNGKSAMDAAVACATIGKKDGATIPPVQLVRRKVWYFPRFLLGLVHYKFAFHSRFGSALFPRYFAVSNPLLKLAHWLTKPFKWVFWRIVELGLYAQYRFSSKELPPLNTIDTQALHTSAAVADDSTNFKLLRSGEINMKVGTIKELKPGLALLSDGTEISLDLLILGTGWKMDQRILDDRLKSRMGFDDDGLWLYRQVLAPRVPGLAFVLSNSVTYANACTAYLQAMWLAHHMVNNSFPSPEKMDEERLREKEFKRKIAPFSIHRGAIIQGYMQHYHDLLLVETGRNPMCCGGIFGPFKNWMMPVVPSTFESLVATP